MESNFLWKVLEYSKHYGKYFVGLECGEVRSLPQRSGGSPSGITGLWWPVVDIGVE